MKKIFFLCLILLLFSSVFADRATDAAWGRAWSRQFIKSGLASSGSYFNLLQASDKLIDSTGRISALYVDSLYTEGGVLTVNELYCLDNVGTASDSVSAVVEYGDGHWHKTVLTVDTYLDSIAGGAAFSAGILLYTFPAGSIIVKAAYMSIALDEDDGNITADDPEIGLGTTIGSGTNATLGAVNAAAENIITAQVAADCDGTATVKTIANQILVIEATGDHTVYLNVADTWAASGEDNLNVAGTVVIEWVFVK